MSKAFVAPGLILDLPAPAGGVVSGAGYQIGNIFGFAERSETATNIFPLAVKGVFTCLSDTGTAWSPGDLLYWDNTNKVVTKTAGSNLKIGAAVTAKTAAATTGMVYLPAIVG